MITSAASTPNAPAATAAAGGSTAPPAYGPGRKQGFGTSPTAATRVSFTIARGNLSDVFFPRLDRPALNGLRFLVAAPGAPPIDDAVEAQHDVTWLRPGVPAFTVHSRHTEYALTKEFICDTESNGVLISGRFEPDLPDLGLYLQASPHLAPGSAGNSAFVVDVEPPVLVARQDDVWIAVVGPFSRVSVGRLNESDLFVDLYDNDGDMTEEQLRVEQGNVALGAELGLAGGPFQVAVGFAHARTDAIETARQLLRKGTHQLRQDFERAWLELDDIPREMERVSGDSGALARASLTVLRCLEDKNERGAFVASPSAPWGDAQQDGNHVYHLVWPRDTFHIATALIDAGDAPAALRALRYLEKIQRPNGGWPQNCTLDGREHWRGVELDQVAYPILLAWRLGVAGALDHDVYTTLVRRAAGFIVANGPSTPLDRWEDAGGLSPSTLAACIGALAAAEEFAYDAGDHRAAVHLRAVADYWTDRLEAWCFDARRRSYVRLSRDADDGPTDSDVVGVEFLELVRRGIRAADHPYVLRSLDVADAMLRVPTPLGSAWRRYFGDTYGERADGRPWNGTGFGRPWPLLAGERAHHSLAMGHGAADGINALESFAGPEMMLPEQVWDAEAIPDRELEPGKATGSAAPLGWAHAEYLKLLAAVAVGQSPDVVAPARRRYVDGAPRSPAFVWSHAHPVRHFLSGRTVKVQLPSQALVTWTADRWTTRQEVEARDTSLGVWVADLPTEIMRPGAAMEWTAEYATGREGRNYTLVCRAE